MPAPLEIKVISIHSTDWTPVTVPFDCSSIAVKNTHPTNGVRMRTNSNDPATQDVLGAGGEQAFAVPFHRYRFLAGSQPVWLQCEADSSAVVVKFLA